jgi:MFS transporter, ceroid-lipofuscinosis neuronal protein 7
MATPPDLLSANIETPPVTTYVNMTQADNDQGYGNDNDNDDSADISLVSSILTAEGIHDMTGFWVACLVIFIGDMCRGVFFPSMWPLVQKLGGTQVTLGYAVAAYSFGRILVNPLFGAWSYTYGYTATLLLSVLVLLVGTLLYAAVLYVARAEFLIVAQTVLGVGSGTLGVTRAFVADVTDQRHRTTYIAWITAVQYAGFTVTPLLGAAFNYWLQDDERKVLGVLPVNMYTAPAYFMTFMSVLSIGIILVFFRDRRRVSIRKEQTKKSARRQAIEQVAMRTTCIGLTVYDCCLMGCMLLNISTKGSIASFETMGIFVAQSHFGLTTELAGLVVGCCGVLGVGALLSMEHLSRHFSDVHLIGGGMVVMSAGVALLLTLETNVADNPTWKYVVAICLLYSIGYPIGHTAVIGLFSKGQYRWESNGAHIVRPLTFRRSLLQVVGRRHQGELQGWFASAGSLARMIFPIMTGYVTTYIGLQSLFCILISVLIVSTVFVAWARTTLTLLSS